MSDFLNEEYHGRGYRGRGGGRGRGSRGRGRGRQSFNAEWYMDNDDRVAPDVVYADAEEYGTDSYSGGATIDPRILQSSNAANPPPPPPAAAPARRSPIQIVEEGWQYLDPEGQEHGPFLAARMAKWIDQKYFSTGLHVRKVSRNSAGAWTELRYVLADIKRDAALTLLPITPAPLGNQRGNGEAPLPVVVPVAPPPAPAAAARPPPPPPRESITAQMRFGYTTAAAGDVGGGGGGFAAEDDLNFREVSSSRGRGGGRGGGGRRGGRLSVVGDDEYSSGYSAISPHAGSYGGDGGVGGRGGRGDRGRGGGRGGGGRYSGTSTSRDEFAVLGGGGGFEQQRGGGVGGGFGYEQPGRGRGGSGRGGGERGRGARGRGGRGGRGGAAAAAAGPDPEITAAASKLFTGEVSLGTEQPLWRYIDPQGSMQGPFPARDMESWYQEGYLADPALKVCGAERKVAPPNLPPPEFFIPLGALIYWVRRGHQFTPVSVADVMAKKLPEALQVLKDGAEKVAVPVKVVVVEKQKEKGEVEEKAGAERSEEEDEEDLRSMASEMAKMAVNAAIAAENDEKEGYVIETFPPVDDGDAAAEDKDVELEAAAPTVEDVVAAAEEEEVEEEESGTAATE